MDNFKMRLKAIHIGLFVVILIFCSTLVLFATPSNDLLSPQKVDYLIITSVRYASIFQQLADWKTAKGVSTKVVSLEWIMNNYTKGDSPSKIREFIKDAKKTLAVKWVILGGDTKDDRGDLIPVRYVTSMGNTHIPSDLYYADLSGSWDGNNNHIFGEFNDDCDLESDVFIGRASVDSMEEASNFVNKVLAYEKNPPKNWVKKALLVGMDLDSDTPGEKEADMLANDYLKGFKIAKFYQSQGATSEKIREGFCTFNPHIVYVGAHGNRQIFCASNDSHFTNDMADKLSNTFPFIYASISCLTNYFDEDSLSEHMLNNPKGGAVAYWACSREGYYEPRNEGYYYSILMIKDFFNMLFMDPKNISNHIGEAVARARARYIPEAKEEDGQFRWLVFGMNLLGDPEMPVWTNEPKDISIEILKSDENKSLISAKIMCGKSPVDGANACLRFFDERSLELTISGKNLIPRQMKIAYPTSAGIYAKTVSDENGVVSFNVQESLGVVHAKINELIFLDSSIRSMEAYLAKIRGNGPLFQKLTRDYTFLQTSMEQRRKEIRAFFIKLAENKKFGEIEEALDTMKCELNKNPAAVAQFKFVMKALSDKLRFDFVQLQNNGTIQSRIFNKILDLQKGTQASSSTKGTVEVLPPEADSGVISVTSTPSGATVYLNNIPKGETPCIITGVSFGDHVIKVLGQGMESISRKVPVLGKKTVAVNFELENGCSIKGKVTLINEGPCTDAVIEITKAADDTVLFHGTPDSNGNYQCTGLPKKNINMTVTKKGYSEVYKPFLFSQRDQGFKRIYDIVMVPLFKISGKISDPLDAKIRLFKNNDGDFSFCEEKSPTRNGTYVFEKLEPGSYKIICSKPGRRLFIREFTVKDGKDQVLNIECSPLKTFSFYYVNSKLEGHLVEELKNPIMEADDRGVYSCEVELEAESTPYLFFFMQNHDDYKNDHCLSIVYDDKFPMQKREGYFWNVIEVKKTGKICFKYDSTKHPVYYKKTSGENYFWISKTNTQLKIR